jgi:cellulose 1,4-beta-cellobiosidase
MANLNFFSCDGNACGGTYSTDRYGGTCDPDGCDFNSYRMGDTTFYGPGMTVNTNDVFTVVTQFIGNPMTEIKRFYVQNGVVIPNSQSTIPGITGNSITETYCDATKTVFNNTNTWDQHGGFSSMTAAMEDGMVLVMSLWDDYYANMLWLDSDYPTTDPVTQPGIARGTCSTSSGVPATIESSDSSAYVIYSNIRVGAINSTYTGTSSTGTGSGSGSSTTATTLKTSTTSSSGSTSTGTAGHYAQCGGIGYTGPTTCASPYTCKYSNAYYSQCL